MQIFPTRPAVHVALSALLTITAGVALRLPAAVAWGGAMIVAIALSRAMTTVAILRLRAAGLEMIWRSPRKGQRVAHGGQLVAEVELKNRDSRPVRYVSLRPIASRELEVSIEPKEGTIPGGTSASLSLTVRAPRVGRHCVHGLALEVSGPPGVFEVPLAFANPLGIEVVPRAVLAVASSPAGGRARLGAGGGPPDRRPGVGTELFELREHVSGDPFKHIAWRASARRGRLMVREFERDDRDIVWLVVDAAVELWAGPLGRTPLDHAVDEAATLAQRHLARGDKVGLAVAGISPRYWLAPDRGPVQGARIGGLLVGSASVLDADRSDYDELDVARRVLEHLRFLNASSVAGVRSDDLDGIQALAEAQRSRAPFDLEPPLASSPRERSLRRYLACHGISSPPRLEQDRSRAIAQLLQALEHTGAEKPRPSLVYVWSPVPEATTSAPLAKIVHKLLRRGVRVRWAPSRHEPALEPTGGPVARAAIDAVLLRTRIARERGERLLASLGVRLFHRELASKP